MDPAFCLIATFFPGADFAPDFFRLVRRTGGSNSAHAGGSIRSPPGPASSHAWGSGQHPTDPAAAAAVLERPRRARVEEAGPVRPILLPQGGNLTESAPWGPS